MDTSFIRSRNAEKKLDVKKPPLLHLVINDAATIEHVVKALAFDILHDSIG
jgi:hypothetical protein